MAFKKSLRPTASDSGRLWLPIALTVFPLATVLLARQPYRVVAGIVPSTQAQSKNDCDIEPVRDTASDRPYDPHYCGPATEGCYGTITGHKSSSRRFLPHPSTREIPSPVRRSISEGLAWLAAQQRADGSWESDPMGLRYEEGLYQVLPNPGDVEATSLALLVFLGDDSTTRSGRYRQVVKRAVKWLGQQQDSQSGLIGPEIGERYAIHHAMACLVMADNYFHSRNPFQKLLAKRALQYIERSQNLDGSWHQEEPCRESMDPLLTGWNLQALTAGIDSGLRADPVTIDRCVAWLQVNTDLATGRIGPDPSSDAANLDPESLRSNKRISAIMTRAGWFAQVSADRPLKQSALVQVQANKARKELPAWRPDGLVDWQGWFFGTHLMFQVGGDHWEQWNEALTSALIPHQSMDEGLRGSWPPGFAGGRIQSTALALLALQVPYRHRRLLKLDTKE